MNNFNYSKPETPDIIPKTNYQELAERIFSSVDIGEDTKKEYLYRIKFFLAFIEKNGFGINSFLDYKKLLRERTDYSVSYKNKFLASARIFLKEMNRLGFLPMDITQNVKTFRQDKRHKVDGLTEEEVGRISEHLKSLPDTGHNARLRAIIALLALQGLRQCEVVRLEVKDLDLVGGTASILGKGLDDKQRVFLHPTTTVLLKKHLAKNKISDGKVFVGISNNQRKKCLTTRGLRKIVKSLHAKLSIEKTVHGWRHYFTSRLIREYDGDIMEIAKLTRHKSLEMLLIYNDNIKQYDNLPKFINAFSFIDF
jgi:integrase